MKIIDNIRKWSRSNPDKPFFSFEFFPPKTETGLYNLYERFDLFASLSPLWINVTWGAGGTKAEKTLEMCQHAITFNGLEATMHLSCNNMVPSKIDEVLEQCKEIGIQNILALRGDIPPEESLLNGPEGGFAHAVDLVKYIREKHGDYFCIVVAGYPEGHLENPSKEDDLLRLKEKVDAGADLVISQLFYEVSLFTSFVDRCRQIGITVPIIPGIMAIQSYIGFKKMISFCKTYVPNDILTKLEEVKDDDQKVKDFGVELGVNLCRQLINAGVPGLHFYTLNLEVTVLRILNELNLADIQRSLPWRPMLRNRAVEDVRPIFWANRPKSYIQRTMGWDDFPNGRWGNKDSPAYGEPHYSMSIDPTERSAKVRAEMWGVELTNVKDVMRIFIGFLSCSQPKQLPWCSETLGDETAPIKQQLVKLTRLGLLTTNSQPRVNGALSTDPVHGWGPVGGFIYQKGYIEGFCSQETLLTLYVRLCENPQFSFMAVNKEGTVYSNAKDTVNAVTWGVFPNSEIKQPTVVDYESFIAWKQEAFNLWDFEWSSLYPEDSQSKAVIEEIENNWFLVNIVDNNYVSGDLFGFLLSCLSALPAVMLSPTAI